MAEIINLRMARKAQRRTEHEQQATENRYRYGQSLLQKSNERAEQHRLTKRLDGAKIEASKNISQPLAFNQQPLQADDTLSRGQIRRPKK